MLLRPQDHNTGFYFRPPGDALERTYRAPYDAPIGDLNDYVTLYQSRTPLIDNTKLPPTDHLDAGGVDVAIFKDLKRSFDPYGIGTGQTDDRSHTYYAWSENGLHYMAYFRGLDDLQRSLIQELLGAEGQ
ncbi:hypothetical protein [Cohnella sp. GbtcB17]|uniref:hypothetical protein n=1 Tax=Cohnella sp. GbtcB17 TaxID=2824762 RepID=UPI001C2FC0FD|nr:hypothetical protein [Cohnella sp. GbtcB17]